LGKRSDRIEDEIRLRGFYLRIQSVLKDTSHPALRAIFAHKGSREEDRSAVRLK
jgi:hypothetical protein